MTMENPPLVVAGAALIAIVAAALVGTVAGVAHLAQALIGVLAVVFAFGILGALCWPVVAPLLEAA